MADEYRPRPLHHPDCVCGGKRNPDITAVAEEYGFTYQEAFDYVILVGIAYTSHPPAVAQEPGA